jgi:protease-4
LVFDYGETPTPPVQSGFSGLVQLFSMIGSKGTDSTSIQNKIAIVYICGMIVEGESEEYFSGEGTTVGSETLRKTFSEIQKNDKIKAVVLRINSPGGSSSASEIIWQLVDETRKTKPVVVSMGSTAASGGYYIACAGSPILLSPMTITGSIGVIAGKPNIQGLMEKVHLHHYNWSRGKNSRLTDMLSPLTADERKNLHAQMQHIYDTFKDRVTRSRKGKIADVSKLATGRVFTGMQAIKLGLADQIGTLADAVELAAQQAKIKSYTVVHRPKPKTLPEIIMEALGYKLDGESDISDSKILAKFVLNSSRFVSISGLSGEAIAKSLAIISMLKRNSILTMMTFDIELR